jgi:hypothetical protein
MDLEAEWRRARRITGLLLAAVALVGLAHVAFLPPWEGFDETAHWSYIQEMADTGRGPVYGVDRLAADLGAYKGPWPYGVASPDKTYRAYGQAGAPRVAGGPTRYAPGADMNWQAQHPPLYYALMAPVYRLAQGLGWIDHLLVLRLASFALAFAGFAWGVWATARRPLDAADRVGVWTGPIMAAWPLFFPQFFPEFARLGNDSLSLLLATAAWVLTLRLLSPKGGWASAALLGVALGLGLLTKAFFLPISAGVGVLLLVRWWARRTPQALGQAVLAGAVALAIGGWWYLAKQATTGSLVGSDEFIKLNHAGGAALMATHFSAAKLAVGLAAIPATFAWAGTWSLARLPEVLLVFPVAILALTGLDYLRTLDRRVQSWAPIAFAAPLLAGLIYHVLVWTAGVGAETPGWYLHILAAPLGFAVALGWHKPLALGLLTVATGLYAAAAWAFQLSMFSGCAAKLGADKHYDLAGARCFVDLHALGALGHPMLGFAALAVGVLLALAAGIMALRAYQGRTVEFIPLT